MLGPGLDSKPEQALGLHHPLSKVESADYLIVGGGLAGFNAAVAIRKNDPSRKILLVGDEPHLPYNRVPLSKEYLNGKRIRDRVFLWGREFYDQQRIEVLTGKLAVKLDIKRQFAGAG